MALLLKDRDTPSEAGPGPPAGESPVTVTEIACRSCGAGMHPGQDWCLECGSAAPGRLGARPGWRAAFSVVSVTLLLLLGGVVASYAALTSNADRTASAPSAGNGAPIAAATTPVAPVVPVTPGATGPGTVPPAAGAALPGATAPPATGTVPPVVIPPPAAGTTTPPATGKPLVPVKPVLPPANTQVKPPATTQVKPPATTQVKPPATTRPPATGSTGATTPPAVTGPKPEIVKFKADAASTYDPGKRAGAEFGPAANAVDKSPTTVWDVLTPADGNSIGAGLLLDLGKPYALRAIKLTTPTEDFDVEIYGAVSAKHTPVDILDKRWEHVRNIKGVTNGQLVSLLGKSKSKLQLLLIYVTTPADPADPRVAIGKVTVAGTP